MLFTIPFLIPPCNRLDYETIHITKRNGIRWTSRSQLDDLDFTDDMALLSHTQQQENTNAVVKNSEGLGLKIHRGKSRILKVNSTNTVSVILGVEAIKEFELITYLGSVADARIGTESDVKAWIGKVWVAFLQLKNIWKSKVLSLKNKIRIFNTNVKAVLLYGAETWRTTVTTTKRTLTFVNSCYMSDAG